MNKLTVINNQQLEIKEFKGQRVISFKDIDTLHERVEGTASRNFLENKYNKDNTERFIEGTDYFNITRNQNNEIRGLEIPNRGLTLISESGYLMLVKSLSDDLAWKVQRELINNYFRVKENLPQLSKELQAIFVLDQRTVEIDNRLIVLEGTMTIDFSQQEVLRTSVNKKIVETLGGKDAPAYKECSKKAFSQLWKAFKRVMQVNSYRNTAAKEYEQAKETIKLWEPNRELELMILGANRQLKINL